MLLMLTLLAAAGPPSAPTISEVEVVPGVVMVHPSTTEVTAFTLEALLWTGPTGARVPFDDSTGIPSLSWSSGKSWLQVSGQSGRRVFLSISANATPGDTAILTVTAQGKSSPPALVVTTNGTTPDDRSLVTARYSAWSSPSVVFALEADGSDPCVVRSVAFVRQAQLGGPTQHCASSASGWNVAVAAPDRPMVFGRLEQTGGLWMADLSAAQGTDSAVVIPVVLKVMVADPFNLDSATKLAETSIRIANRILADNRAGISLAVTEQSAVRDNDQAAFAACPGADPLLAGAAPTPPGQLHIFYSTALKGIQGVTCDGTPEYRQGDIFVSIDRGTPTTLLHEVGHALGLTLPGKGHTDLAPGFDIANLMAGSVTDKTAVARRRFSLGQVFRMNVDSVSWLNRVRRPGGSTVRTDGAPVVGCQCGLPTLRGPCPALSDDIARPRPQSSSPEPPVCQDSLILTWSPGAGAPFEPIALVAGRRAGAPLIPGACTTDALAHATRQGVSHHFGFDNLTRDMGCPSSITIFSAQNAMVHQRLVEDPNRPFSTVADLDSRLGTPRGLIEVPIELYYAGTEPLRLNSDTLEAIRVFGADNYVGIRLVFTTHSSVACPTTSASESTIVVCYTTSPQTSSLQSGIVRLPVTTGASYDFSHLVGRALGLDAIADAAPRFPGNVMRVVAASRGPRLTLGQVFRIQAHLGCGPDACDPDAYPPLAASAAP